ncbi:MAG: hypothetical protein R3F43_17500 [bacterium]
MTGPEGPRSCRHGLHLRVPADLTTDAVVFGLDLEAGRLRVLLVERGVPLFEGAWALPGGF